MKSKRQKDEGWTPISRPLNFYTPAQNGEDMTENELFLAGYIDRTTVFRLYMSNHDLSAEALESLIGMIRHQHKMAAGEKTAA